MKTIPFMLFSESWGEWREGERAWPGNVEGFGGFWWGAGYGFWGQWGDGGWVSGIGIARCWERSETRSRYVLQIHFEDISRLTPFQVHTLMVH